MTISGGMPTIFVSDMGAAVRFYTEALGYEPSDSQRREIAGLRHQVQARIADACEGLVFVKTHQALVSDRGSTTINSAVTAGAVYIVRNPLDVAISYAHHTGHSIDDTIADMAQVGFETTVGERAVYEVYGSWSQHVLSWTRKPHPAIFMHALNGLRRASHESAMVGYRLDADVLGAAQLGMFTIWRPHRDEPQTPGRVTPDTVITQIADLLDIFP